MTRQSFWTEGVDLKALSRTRDTWRRVETSDGRLCRDRLSWGGITYGAQACVCKGVCLHDVENKQE